MVYYSGLIYYSALQYINIRYIVARYNIESIFYSVARYGHKSNEVKRKHQRKNQRKFDNYQRNLQRNHQRNFDDSKIFQIEAHNNIDNYLLYCSALQ